MSSLVGIQWEVKGLVLDEGVMFPGLKHWVEWEPAAQWCMYKHNLSSANRIRLPWSPPLGRDKAWASLALTNLFSRPPAKNEHFLTVVVFWTNNDTGFRLAVGARNSQYFQVAEKVLDLYSVPAWFDRSLFPELAVFEVMTS